MLRALTAATLAALMTLPAQAVRLKELVFTGTIASGVDQSGDVFFPTPALLNGLPVTGRYVWDADLMPGATVSGATLFSWTTPGWEFRGGTWLGALGPFMSASITVNGVTRSIRNQPVNPATGPASHVLGLNDVPGAPAQDNLNVSVSSVACFSCTSITDEYLQLQVGGLAGGLLSGESPAQDFQVSGFANLFSGASFQLNSGFSVSGVDIPNDPAYGNTRRHYAAGSIAVNSVLLRDVPAVPEPGSWALMAAGLGLGALRLLRLRIRQL